jgi:flagellar biosynthesis/type III secretory pathway M-ring protein FliF/YscJ
MATGLDWFSGITTFVGNITGGALNFAAANRGYESSLKAGQYNLLGLQEQGKIQDSINAATLDQLRTGIIYVAIAIVAIIIFFYLIKWVTK